MQTKYRNFNLSDKILLAADNFLTTILHKPNINQNYPGKEFSKTKIKHPTNTISMLKQNHAGEVCAQALYQAQNLGNSNKIIEQHLYKACKEEFNHLNWCGIRLIELNSKPSKLTPLIYIQAYILGSIFSVTNQKINLGFIATYESLVVEHLEKHINKINDDIATKTIFNQMKLDEINHSQDAISIGGEPLGYFLKQFLKINSKIILFVSSIT